MKKSSWLIFFCFISGTLQSFAGIDLQNIGTFFTTENGLSSTKITCIRQDNRNFLWIGTEDGLNRFDGYEFTVYKKESEEPLSLISSHITVLFQDSHNRMWVGTIAGLEYYDLASDGFINASLNQPDEVIKYNQCTDIVEDSRENLWVTSSGFGVVCYSLLTEESILFTPSADSTSSLCSSYIRSIVEDAKGNIWFASQDKGISVYNPVNATFRNYNTANSSLPSNAVFDLELLSNGNILVSTLRGGLAIYDVQKDNFETFPDLFNEANTRSVFCSIEDFNGDILVGTEGKGVLILDPQKRTLKQHPVFLEMGDLIGDSKVHSIYKGNYTYLWFALVNKGVFVLGHEDTGFKTLQKLQNNPNSLNYGSVTSITTDVEQNIWIATDGGGLNCYHPNTNSFTYYTNNPLDSRTISDNAIVNVFCDSKNRIWVGTYTGGLCLLNRETKTFTRFTASDAPDGLQSDYVKSIKEDKRGFLWLGTNGGGLSRFDPEKRTFRTFRSADNRGLVNDYIITLFIDSRDRMWIGTYFGLSCMDIDTETFTFFGRENGLSSLSIYSLAEDENGTIWVGTEDGLNRYHPDTNTFTKVYPKSQYYSPVVNGILAEDGENNLWLSTNHGIVRYSVNTGELMKYLYNSGLQSNEFLLGSYYKDPGGQMFFGGVKGLNMFYPANIYDEVTIPKVYINNLQIFNESVPIGKPVEGRVLLNKNIEISSEIHLKQNEKNFTLEYVALGIFDPNMTLYKSKLEGFNDDWTIYDYTQRSMTYTNLNPGTYTFRIKASSNPDVWGDAETTLRIVVEPSIWNTWWAKLIYLLLAISVAGVLLWALFNRIKAKNELDIERLKVKQQEELHNIRTNFFTNISHEFRTPLTLILGPLERLMSEETDESKKQAGRLIVRSAKRLQSLINQILDVNKMENSKMVLHVRRLELVSFVEETVRSFGELFEQKPIHLSYTSDPDTIIGWYDPDLLDKCISNILHNAYKFTPPGGEVSVNLHQADDLIRLSISDTGIGMDPQTQERVFDRFYQADTDKYNAGTGIGMHFTKMIVELHKGCISVESEKGAGSRFTISILAGNSHFSPEELDTQVEDTERPSSVSLAADTPSPLAEEPRAEGSRPTILLVEDDPDMRLYIRKVLEDSYHIQEASNGKGGLKKAHSLMPDLIITDVMMPEMSGLELCSLLKTDPDTSHIPVIILTAKDGTENLMEGLETGADSYISKPFELRHLKIRVEKLIELRNKLKDRFSKSFTMDAQEVTVSSTDERLLQHAIDYVREHMEDSDLTVESMSRDLGLSRTHLHRKLKALTGQSPVEFIKIMRLKQAAYLLSTGKLTISEVSYKVGYGTPSYFSSSFNAYFGMSPTAYMEEKRSERPRPDEDAPVA
ncbi:signal transduction histidine kinase/ligand-binding sensor domain-containing protein/DNA-binding response OmpR family regulator [Parabacteroides sp. PF5-5]|uniref:hybrid sensor histidine kinase/response regulator transcription factor n=1 Tax=unclassified Parabacteroides TaxID=2649774 RepID=UPI002473EB9D|nr:MULTISPECIES: two-component regulator propeller domain-containing protein [unclassified Parabacteroides]MDH6305149.1 signal transduction histidine kinase/ligand-binding sensor domain-containing protein/DNA-binding response OmpR family regulator [Parabacteroides sp. PH5-39]MDH6316499.1 signal transduction histidine kinase/ligand-binding sensor domain-containing protein/DNA-binding response OmpR family regulator [Parabacteroides sp. PF5-13]MDH6320009.1 signal transduction histidine kinase/ligan